MNRLKFRKIIKNNLKIDSILITREISLFFEVSRLIFLSHLYVFISRFRLSVCGWYFNDIVVFLFVSVCVCMYLCIFVYVCISLCLSVCVWMDVSISLCLSVSVWMYVFLCRCLSVCMSGCISVCLSVCMFMSVCVCVWVSIDIIRVIHTQSVSMVTSLIRSQPTRCDIAHTLPHLPTL